MKGVDAATTTRIEFMAFALPTGDMAVAEVGDARNIKSTNQFTKARESSTTSKAMRRSRTMPPCRVVGIEAAAG